jgi:hypothetical protein
MEFLKPRSKLLDGFGFLSAEFADEIGSWQGWHAAITLLTPSAKNSLALQQILGSTLG